uniref:Holin n=1 Tax=viral metagenome TaxID=1070528 RepID=A0A6M3J5K6_9ZZZZ
MGNFTWVEVIIVIIPSVIAIILGMVSIVLKLKKDSMTGMSKELSEFVLSIIEASKDRQFTQSEILKIISEGEDVIREAKKLLTAGA